MVAAALRRVAVQNEGFLSLYQGIGPQIFRGVLSSAIMLSCKEKLYSSVRAALPAGGVGGLQEPS